ncbi:T9SS type A sorting domain-containing protein [Hymenobacter sp. B81]|uniref:T9SS type A sorting domain-containing protein n=1 Tax=Hymenobacter sp. B81 TaxID=3344878 RepID=UPI0037DC8BFC
MLKFTLAAAALFGAVSGWLPAATAQHRPFEQLRPTSPTELLQARPQSAAARTISSSVQRPGQVVSYGYDSLAQAWVKPARTRFTYDGRGREILQEVADSASGRAFSRMATTYNAADQVTETLTEVNFTGTWNYGTRNQFSYDTRRQLTQELYQFYNASGTWYTFDGIRYQNVYNAAGHLTEQTLQHYRPGTGAFVDSVRYLFHGLAPSGEWAELIIQRPSAGGQWTNWERQLNVVWYDFGRKLMSSAQAQVWDNNRWELVTRLTGTYTATHEVQMVEERLAGNWVNAQRHTVTYDAQGSLTGDKTEDWTGTSWGTVFEVALNLYYHPDGTVRRRIVRVDSNGAGLQYAALDNFSGYQTFVLAARASAALAPGALQAYPNPSADGRFTVQLNASSATGELRVTDALGRLVHRQPAPSLPGTESLDLSQHPAGVYTLELRTAAGIARQQVVR